MEPEYIKREALFAEFDRLGLGEHSLVEKVFADGVYAVIAAMPAADVAPVVHGHFVHDGPRFAGGVDWWHCSSCGKLAAGVETRFNYCPRCGARMDGGACSQECKYNTPDRGCIAKTIGARCDLENAAGKRGGGEAG